MANTFIAAGTAKLTGVARTKFYLGTTTTTFANDTLTEVGGVMELPNIGPSDQAVKVQLLGNDLEVTLKGVTAPGGGSVMLGSDLSDAGQVALIAAQVDKSNDYWMCFIQPNPATSTGTGTIIYWKGRVLSFQDQYGGPNNPIKATVDIGLNTRPARISAT